MDDNLQRIKAELAYDRGTPAAEWEVVERLLEEFESERDQIVRWLFEDYDGYIVNRARAGLELFRLSPSEGWAILEHLVGSANPDDRDTAFTVLETLGGEDAARLARPLLEDEWSYIQLEAARFLANHYPAEVAAMLGELLRDDSRAVREEAQRLLSDMGEDAPP